VNDPLAMYYVVRKDARMWLSQAMALAGAAAVRCSDDLSGDPRFAEEFAAWAERPRKVALRASAEEIAALRAELSGAFLAQTLLCLPPMRKSDRPALLAALRPFTDAPRPKEDMPATEPGALVYAIRPGVVKTMGKLMAQAGHAALMFVREQPDAARRWREAGMPGTVREVDGEEWERLKAEPGAVVVRDAGLTQVEAGTETVIALAPTLG
jgi:peptidyl-tRNA hydrolase